MLSTRQSPGVFFAVGGGFFTLSGMGMLLVQAVWGEWLFDGKGPRKPLGAEFGLVFFTMGQIFLFLGLGMATRMRKRRPVFNFLASANGLMVGLLIVALIWQSAVDLEWSLTWEPLIAWGGLLLLGYNLAHQHPDYRHADQMPELQEPTPVVGSGSPGFASRGNFLRQITRKDWKRAALVGGGVGLLPVLIMGSFILSHFKFDNPTELVFIAGFLLFGFLMFASFGGVATLIFSVFLRAWRRLATGLREEYQKFAQQVDGEVETASPGQLGSWPSLPRKVVFPYADQEARLEMIEEGSGDSRITYTHLTFPLPRATDFDCRVSSEVGPALIGRMFGLKDISLGWPLFDDTFVVKANNEYRAGEILNRKVQEELIQLRHWAETVPLSQAGGTPTLELRIEAGDLILRIEGMLESAEKLLDFHNRGIKFCDLIHENIRT